jgi:MPBQ/MSBQ methyltransferase
MAEQQPLGQSVESHYARRDLEEAILQGLRAAGKDLDLLTPDDLAPADHFHLRGKEATLELARRAEVGPETKVLDVGGGIGGAARTLAGAFGCSVTVLDLTEEFCRVGAALTGRVGLDDRVMFRHASALEMPFAEGSFDLAWTEHSTMNIEDKERLYQEIRRVLRPGGRLALHEIMAGPAAPIHFPVPWAKDGSISFLRAPEEVRAVLRATGFEEVAWVDVTAPSLSWLRERLAALPRVRPPLGPHLLLGDLAPAMFQNVARNLEEDRIRVFQCVFRCR